MSTSFKPPLTDPPWTDSVLYRPFCQQSALESMHTRRMNMSLLVHWSVLIKLAMMSACSMNSDPHHAAQPGFIWSCLEDVIFTLLKIKGMKHFQHLVRTVHFL